MELRNRSAFHEYFFETTYVAGIVLVGTEVKSLRAGKVSFNDAYCQFHKGNYTLKISIFPIMRSVLPSAMSPHRSGNYC